MRGFQNCCEKENLKIYVNPPYSDVTPFLIRAKELRDAGHLVVMLLNNDKIYTVVSKPYSQRG